MNSNLLQKLGSIRILLKGIGMHILCAVIGFIAATGRILGEISPFGISFCAGVQPHYAAASATGAIIGYILQRGGTENFLYIAAAFAMGMLRMLTKDFEVVWRKSAVLPICAFVITFTARLAGNPALKAIPHAAVVAVFCAFCTAVIRKSALSLCNTVSGLPLKRAGCVMISFYSLFLGLYSVNIGQLNIGRLVFGTVILCSSVCSGAGGAVCGAAAGAAWLLYNPSHLSTLAVFSLGGLICGLVCGGNKLIASLAFVLTGCCSVLVLGISEASVALMCEVVLGTALFLLMPNVISVNLGRLLSPPADTATFDGMRHALAMRLDFASKTLQEVCQTVDTVSKSLSKQSSPDFNEVIAKTEQEACRGCVMRSRCWDTLRSETIEVTIELARFARESRKPPLSEKAVEFGSRCNRIDAVMNALNRNYSDYIARVAATSNAERIRKIISGQFCGISQMLYDVSREFRDKNRFDLRLANELSSELFDFGLTPYDCCCIIDGWGRMTVEVCAKVEESTTINRIKLNRLFNAVCGREFAVPLVSRTKDRVLITANESTVFEVDMGAAQLNCANNSICGDSYEQFFDGRGRMFMVLSDGMGHGNRAALDSTMASGMMSRLLRAGFGYDSSLEIINSSMIYKSVDESLATIDVSVIDLFTGKADILKAGAAPTLMRRQGRTGKAQSTSLPAGILQEIGFDKATVELKKDDIVLMLSDGAVFSGTDWICAELEAWQDGTAQQLCEKIALAARDRRDDGHSDDITVMAAILKKAM